MILNSLFFLSDRTSNAIIRNRFHNVKLIMPQKNNIQVLDRMSSLLDAVARYPEPVSLKVLAAETGLHSSTAFRILDSMLSTGFVERDAGGKYQLGRKLLSVGSRAAEIAWRLALAAARRTSKPRESKVSISFFRSRSSLRNRSAPRVALFMALPMIMPERGIRYLGLYQG